MVKYCNTIKLKLNNNGEIIEKDVYVKTCHILNVISTYTEGIVRRHLGLIS